MDPAKRHRLPPQRSGITVKIYHGPLEGYVTTNFYENQQPGEIFIVLAKQGSFTQAAFDMHSQHVSYLLQLGVPADWLFGEHGKWRHHRVDPMIPCKIGENDCQCSIYDTISNAVLAACSQFGSQPQFGHDLPPEPDELDSSEKEDQARQFAKFSPPPEGTAPCTPSPCSTVSSSDPTPQTPTLVPSSSPPPSPSSPE